MSKKHCWLCVHCDVGEVCDMMKFVEEKSPVMHIDVIANQVAGALKDTYPDEEDIDESVVKEHICRHVVTPVASVTRITRDLLDMCETLRPTRESLMSSGGGRGRKRAIMDDAPTPSRSTRPRTDDEMSVTSTTADERDGDGSSDTAGLYLRAVGQVMGIYRMHAKLMLPA